MEKVKLGILESAIEITTLDGQKTKTITTPAMWALADEFADSLRMEGGHSEQWIIRKLSFAIHMQAARAEGLFPEGPIDTASIAEFLNACEVRHLPSDPASEGGADEEDPTQAAPEDDQGAA